MVNLEPTFVAGQEVNRAGGSRSSFWRKVEICESRVRVKG